MPKRHVFTPQQVAPTTGSGYPEEFQSIAAGRVKHRLGESAGLSQFGVNYSVLPAGEWSALRHYHAGEDEFLMILEGEATLVTDDGEERLGPGLCAAFKAGVATGHHLINRSRAPVVYLEVGSRSKEDEVYYPDVDLHEVSTDGLDKWMRKDGSPIDDTSAD